MNKLYSVHDHWTDIDKKNDVDIESIDGVITGIKVNGEDYGGSEYQNIYDNTITTVLDSDGFYRTDIGVVIEADSIRVTFDGVEYTCPKRSISEISTNFYGAPTPLETGEESFDWTNFPFSIVTGSNGESMVITTQTPGSHSLKIDIQQSGGGSSDFSTAQVTLIGKDGVIAGDVYLPITLDGEDGMPDVAFFLANYVANQQHTYNAIMYKGATLGRIANTAGRSIESIIGNAQDMGNGLLLITGDCTITIS